MSQLDAIIQGILSSVEGFKKSDNYLKGRSPHSETLIGSPPEIVPPESQEQDTSPILEAARQAKLKALYAELEQAKALESGGLPEGFGEHSDPYQTGFLQGRMGGLPGSGQQKTKDLTGTERGEMAAMASGLDLLNKAESKIDQYEDLFGGGTAFGRWRADIADFFGLEGEGSQRRRALDADLREITMRFQQAISGKQMTEQERQFMMSFLPRLEDDFETAKRKIDQGQRYLSDDLARRQAVLQQAGYNVPDFRGSVGGGNAPSGRVTLSPEKAAQILEVVAE